MRYITSQHPVMKFGAAKTSEEALKALDEALKWLNDKLEQHPDRYLAGTVQPTVADLAISAWACTYEAVGFPLAQHPRIVAWLARCRENIKGFKEVGDSGAEKYAEMFKGILKARS